MTRFRYQAVDAAGLLQQGELEAASEAAAVQWLRDTGHLPILAVPVPERQALDLGRLGLERRRVRPADIALLTRALATLLGAGVELDPALAMVDRLAPGAAYRTLAQELRAEIRGGDTLATALARRPALFPDFYVGVVRAGEAGARLGDVMRDLADLLQRLETLGASLRAALVYPLLLLATAVGSILVLLVGVLPRFADIIGQSGAELPAFTRNMVLLGVWLEANGRTALVATLLLLLALRLTVFRRGAAPKWRERLLALPGIAAVTRDGEAARFARLTAMLLSSGMPLMPALEVAFGAATLPAHAIAARLCLDTLRQGRGLGVALAAGGCFPDLLVQLVAMGERSGRLTEMLIESAEILERQAARTSERLLALLVPAVTIGAGLLVALVVGSMMSALMSIYTIAS